MGNVIKLEKATSQKTTLRFARVLVELNTNEEYPEEIHFTNVRDELITQKVTYEWKPILCKKFKKMGHYEQDCKTGEKATKPDIRSRKDKEGFQKVVSKHYVVKQKPPAPETKTTSHGKTRSTK